MTLQAPPEPVVATEHRPPPWSHAAKVARRAHGSLPEPPAPRRRHPVRRTLLAIGAVLLLLFGAGVAYVWWPRPATPITEDEAVARFRGSGGVVPTEQAIGAIAPGVYVYAADGSEQVAIAGVPLPSRDIPDTVTLMVVPEGECQRLSLNLMEEHTESSLYCRDADGRLVLAEQVKQELVAGVTTDGITTCDPGVLGVPGDEIRPVHCLLHMTAAGTEIDVRLDGRAWWTPGETVTVGGEARDTERLVLDLSATGDMSGHMREVQSIEPTTGVPLVIERDILLDGPGRFAEQTVLTLTDLAPRR